MRAPLRKRYSNPASQSRNDPSSFTSDPLSISCGQFIRLSIEGQIKWADNPQDEYLVQAHPLLDEHDVEFRVEPDVASEAEIRQMLGTFKVALLTTDESIEQRQLAAFNIELGQQHVDEWWKILHPPPPPPVIPPKPKEMDPFERLLAAVSLLGKKIKYNKKNFSISI